MKEKGNNIAYIDAANLHKGIDGWKLDYKKFRIWLKEKFSIQKAYIFMGYVAENTKLYNFFQSSGFEIIFKQTVKNLNTLKGNCDTDLVLKTVCDYYENQFDKAIIITGDGDFTSLVNFLVKNKKFERLIAPNGKKCSILLKNTQVAITFLNDLKHKLHKSEKAPDRDRTV